MATARTDLAQDWAQLASLWRHAGVGWSDTVENILELLFAARTGEALVNRQDELTGKAWRSIRRQLFFEDPILAESEGHRTERYFHIPGLLEQTRRIVQPLAHAHGVARALLDYIVDDAKSAPRAPGEFKLPGFLTVLVERLLEPASTDTVYCPFESSGLLALLLAADGWSVCSEVANGQTARIQALFMRIGRWKLDVHVSDPIRNPTWVAGESLRAFDHAVAVATFGFREREDLTTDRFGRFPVRCHYGEAIQLAHLIAQSKGRVALVVPEGFLSRTTGGERIYKDQLLRRGWLDAVISLPRGAFAASSIRTSLLVLDKRRPAERDVLFVDGTSDLMSAQHQVYLNDGDRQGAEQVAAMVNTRRQGTHVAPIAEREIAANGCNLSVDRYVRVEPQRKFARLLDHSIATAEISDIAEVIRPQVIPADDTEPVATFAEVGVSDIAPDGFAQATKIVHVGEKGMAQAERQRLESGDVLLSVKGRIGAVGLVGQERPIEWLASQAFVILRLRRTSPLESPLILYRYLVSPYVQGLLKALASGTTVPSIQMADVRKLRVILPSTEEQEEILRQHEKIVRLRKQISQLDNLATELGNAAWPMTRISVHDADEKVD
jgi:type I restriction enzyme M protein